VHVSSTAERERGKGDGLLDEEKRDTSVILRAASPKYRLNQEIAKNGISSNSPRMKLLGH